MLKLAGLFSIIVMMSIMSIGLSQKYLYPSNPAMGAQKFAYIVVYCGIGMIIGAFLVGHQFRKLEKTSFGLHWNFYLRNITFDVCNTTLNPTDKRFSFSHS